jgi:hypothetical protein
LSTTIYAMGFFCDEGKDEKNGDFPDERQCGHLRGSRLAFPSAILTGQPAMRRGSMELPDPLAIID